MQAVILAGGLATRLGGLCKDIPKSMVPINGRPFLSYQLETLRKGGVSNVVLCVGHLKEQIMDHFGDGRDHGVRISYSCEDRPLGTAGALRNAGALLEDVFCAIYGDSYLSLDFAAIMDHFRHHDQLALMTVFRNDDLYDRSNTAIRDGLVTRYSKTNRRGLSYIDYGANFFRRQVIELIPEGRAYSLERLFSRLVRRRELLAFEVKERFYEIGSPQGLRDCTEYLSRVQPRRANDTL